MVFNSLFSVKLNKSQLNKVVNIVKLSKLKPGFIPLFEVVMIAMLMHSRKNSESSRLMSHHHQPIRTMLLSVVKRKLPSHVPPNWNRSLPIRRSIVPLLKLMLIKNNIDLWLVIRERTFKMFYVTLVYQLRSHHRKKIQMWLYWEVNKLKSVSYTHLTLPTNREV